MDHTEFFHLKDTALETIVEEARTKGNISEQDILILVGSLTEGLATQKSDVDLILITDRPPPTEDNKTSIAWQSGKCLVDMEFIQQSDVDTLLASFMGWSSADWDSTFAAKLSLDERKLLHRYVNGIYLNDPDGSKKRRVAPYSQTELAKLKLHTARHMARTIQVDIVGNLLNQDYRTAAFAAQELLGHATDAVLAAQGLTNPTPKWRSKLIELVSVENVIDWCDQSSSFEDGIWQLHHFPKYQQEVVLDKIMALIAFCRAVFFYAECKLIYPDLLAEDFKIYADFALRDKEQHALLPGLELDVDFHIADQEIYIGRLNEFGKATKVNYQQFMKVLQLDGFSSKQSILSQGQPKSDALTEEALLDEAIEICLNGKLLRA